MANLNLTESRLPEIYPEADPANPGNTNFFNAKNANLLGFNDLKGGCCLVSYFPEIVKVMSVMESFQNQYVVFVDDAAGAVYDYKWSVSYAYKGGKAPHTHLDAQANGGTYALDIEEKGFDLADIADLKSITVACEVCQGGDTVTTLSLRHAVAGLDQDIEDLYDPDGGSNGAGAGRPVTTHLTANIFREYFMQQPAWPQADWKNPPAPGDAVAELKFGEAISNPSGEALIDDVPPLNYPLALLYARLLKAGKKRGRHNYFPEVNQAYYEAFNAGSLELFRQDRLNLVGPCAIVPHFAALALGLLELPIGGGAEFGHIGDNSGTEIKETDIFAAFAALSDGVKTDLYNLARFPKSAFLLSARMLYFLVRKAQEKSHAQFRGSSSDQDGWTADVAGALDTDKYARNVFFEYINGPQEDIGGLEYWVRNLKMKRAISRVHRHDFSRYISKILDWEFYEGVVRIKKVYFARKVVEESPEGFSVSFERINESVLGREEFLLIETGNGMNGMRVRCKFKTGDAGLTGTKGEDLELVEAGVGTMEFVAEVGGMEEMRDVEGNAYTNADDFSEVAIARVGLRHPVEATFNTWNGNIPVDGSANRALVVEVKVDNPAEGLGTQYNDPPEAVVEATEAFTFLDTPQTTFTVAHLDKTNAPRIVDAYLATKTVENDGVNPVNVGFTRIPEGPAVEHSGSFALGRRLFLVVETENMRAHDLQLGLRAADAHLTGTAGELLPLPAVVNVGGQDVQPRFFHGQVVVPTQGQPGAWTHADDLLDNNGANPYANMQADIEDLFVLEIAVMPQTPLDPAPGAPATAREVFDAWAAHILAANAAVAHQRAALELVVWPKAKNAAGDTQYVYFGAAQFDEEARNAHPQAYHNTNGMRFYLENRDVYEVFSVDNTFNFLAGNYQVEPGRNGGANYMVDRRIGRIENDSSDTAVYFYHDAQDNVHEICQGAISWVRPRANGEIIVGGNSDPVGVPAGYVNNGAAPGGDAFWNYYYDLQADGSYRRIVTRDKPNPKSNPNANGTDYGIRRYDLLDLADPDRKVELVRMPDDLDVDFMVAGVQTHVKFGWGKTQRRFAEPGGFAAFIGILAELNYQDIKANGMCFGDATSYPSLEHPNGDSIDTKYIGGQANLNFVRQQPIVDAFVDWGFTNVMVGIDYLPPQGNPNVPNTLNNAHGYNGDHNNHLHSGNFDAAVVDSIND